MRDVDADAVGFSTCRAACIRRPDGGLVQGGIDGPFAKRALGFGRCDTDAMIRCRILDI
jgi:hypothetical protein